MYQDWLDRCEFFSQGDEMRQSNKKNEDLAKPTGYMWNASHLILFLATYIKNSWR